MVDRVLLASKIAAVRDALSRVRAVLPSDLHAFLADRTAREVVVLNLFVGIQECLSLAAHWLADDGATVPRTYAEMFASLAERGVIPPTLAARLSAAAGLRNLVAHQYGVLDWERVFVFATESVEDLASFCSHLADRAG
jgi:uncharacterized protein YutE (UPF0331/DUF86 family)